MAPSPTYPTYHYCTVSIPVHPEYEGSDSDLLAATHEACEAVGVVPGRVGISFNPDDGRTVRLAVRMDEDDLIELLVELYYFVDDWIVPTKVRVLQTMHRDEFDVDELWPDEQVDLWMAEEGWMRQSYRFSTEPWVPTSLVQSIVHDVITATLRSADLMCATEMIGSGVDDTLPGMPEVTFWMTEDAMRVCTTTDVHGVAARALSKACEDVSIERWLRTLHTQRESA
jgi:diadenosine tetraphosphatase ApaH/serine/threonine PP2A family protein phosphatase